MPATAAAARLPARRAIRSDAPRKLLKDARRVQLIEAALKSIAARGLAETTVVHVADGAGMSRGIVNFYFDGKEALMRAALTHLLEEQAAAWKKALRRAEGEPPAARLEALAEALLAPKTGGRAALAAWMAFAAHAAAHAPYRYLIEQHTLPLRETLAELAAESGAGNERAYAAADRVLALARGYWVGALLGGAPEREDAVRVCLEACASATPPRAAPPPPQAESRPPRRPRESKAETQAGDAPVIADLFAM